MLNAVIGSVVSYAVNGSAASYPISAVSIRAASSTVRQIGPVRVVNPSPIMPVRLTSSTVGDSPTTLLDDEGMRIDVPVSSPIAQVTRFAATPTAHPQLEPRRARPLPSALH